MCSCSKCHDHTTDICFYIPFSIIFILIGIVQIISGIWYLLAISVYKLVLHIAIGCWAILSGISGGMVAYVCPSVPKKHEFLLYCSLSVLTLNIVNLVSLEIGRAREIFDDHLQKVLSKEFNLLDEDNGRFITTYSAILSIIIAFIESQITFCFLNRSRIVHRKEKCLRRVQYVDNDQNADLEYVIPKKNEMNGSRKQSLDTTVQVYAKSWVFEGSGEDGYHQPDDSLSPSICSSPATPTPNPNILTPHSKQKLKQQSNKTRRISKASDATSERFNPQMSSFSRCATPSPVPLSGTVTPTNGIYNDYVDATMVVNNISKKPNRLTVDYIPSPHSNSETVPVTVSVKHTSKILIQNNNNNNGPPSVSSQQDDSQYASMLVELEQSLIGKKIQNNVQSPDDTSISTDKYCSSKSSSKDLEFSKELEAALQLIQDLETPSEGPAETQSNYQKFARSESEKTLSAAISLPSPDAPAYTIKTTPTARTPQNGKQLNRNIIHIEPSSQSTSGYSSPNSFSSNAQLSGVRDGERENSVTSDQTNVVRIYIDSSGRNSTNSTNSITSPTSTVSAGTNLLNKGHILNASNLIDTIETHNLQPNDSLNRSFLLFKKRSKLMPQIDFQNRIFKSECLAYLTDEELVARHKCNRDVIRKIEQTVAQKIRGSPRYDETRT